MAKGYSKDLRVRAVAMVEEGESRREVARVLNLAPSTAVRWMDRWTTAGTGEAKPGTGHSRSPLNAYEKWLLDLERKHFVELAKTQKTQDRIAHTMSTGKPLRN